MVKVEAVMVWGEVGEGSFSPERMFWLLGNPHPHWVETTKEGPKLDFRESGFRQFVNTSSAYIITDAMLMFGLQHAYETGKLIEALNPVRLLIRVKPGSFLGMSHHFLGAPFEVEEDDVLREYLGDARRILEEGGFSKGVVVTVFNPALEGMIHANLERIRGLRYSLNLAFT
ncbi:MAG TPA: hypothetical protein EYH49_02365 [Aquifex aeolicus]|nr:hypothetical protein [Aquifex aeolicus]